MIKVPFNARITQRERDILHEAASATGRTQTDLFRGWIRDILPSLTDHERTKQEEAKKLVNILASNRKGEQA